MAFEKAILIAVLGLAATAAVAGEPVYLRPGQCVIVGAQQVCAMQVDATTAATPKVTATKLASCRYGERIDDANLKGWTLYQVVIGDDGKKTETAVKSFGNFDSDKAECERERAAMDVKIPR